MAQGDEALSWDTLPEVRSETELREAIINAILNNLTDPEIRIIDYPGELTNTAVWDILKDIQDQEPIAAFTTEEGLAFNLTPVLSNYSLSLFIPYREEERPQIQPFSGTDELRATVAEILNAYAPRITVETYYFDEQLHDMEAIVRSYYYENPAWAMEMPVLTLSLYPPRGNTLHRIADLTLAYATPDYELRRMAEETQTRAFSLLTELPAFPPAAAGEEPGKREARTLLWLHDTLCNTVLFDNDMYFLEVNTGERQGGNAYTAYGALAGGRAVSEGYAMAFKLLCGELGIECRIVHGQKDGFNHTWNLVRAGETWYHISAGADDMGPTAVYDAFLLSDEDAGLQGFTGFEGQYPAAVPGFWSYETISPPAGRSAEESPSP
jgi:hypothetical protein